MHSLLVDFSNFTTPVLLCIETTVLKDLDGEEEIIRSDRKRKHGERRKPHVLIIW